MLGAAALGGGSNRIADHRGCCGREQEQVPALQLRFYLQAQSFAFRQAAYFDQVAYSRKVLAASSAIAATAQSDEDISLFFLYIVFSV